MTFAPVSKLNINLGLFSLVVNQDWPLHQLDVKNAFLNGDLEEVYMEAPPGLENSSNNQMVCKLKKALHGLKQSLCGWFDKFSKIITQGYRQRQVDQHYL